MNYFAASVTIVSGQSVSAAFDLNAMGVSYVRRVLILAPGTLPEVVNLLVSLDNSTYAVLQSGGDDITFPAAKATQINGFQVRYIKFQADGAVGADRVFTLSISSE